MSASSSSESVSSPEVVSESRGSSVSTGLREEYEDLLRYAVVTPVLNASTVKSSRVLKNQSSGGPPPRSSPPPRPHTPPRYLSRSEAKAKVSKVESDDAHSELSDATPLSSIEVPPPKSSSPIQPVVPERALFGDLGEDDMHPLVADPEVVRLETQLDTWCLDLKRNVLAEFDQARILMMERHQAELVKERQRCAHEIEQLREELERYKELLVTYEQSIARKDHIIANLTRALQKQKEHVDLQRTFSSWKLRHVSDKRESFTSTLAKRHYHRKVMSRVWAAWFGVIQGRWKQRVEKACQSKAEEVCVELTGQYEEQIANVQQSLESCQQEVARLKAERNLYEENMKKAFMRGVCALNLEALTMFQHPENESADQCEPCSNHQQYAGDGAAGVGESQPSSRVPRPHVHPGSEVGIMGPSFTHSDVPSTQLPLTLSHSQSKSGSKSVRVTTVSAPLRAGPPSSSQSAGAGIQLVTSKVTQTTSTKKHIQSTNRLTPAVVVEKH